MFHAFHRCAAGERKGVLMQVSGPAMGGMNVGLAAPEARMQDEDTASPPRRCFSGAGDSTLKAMKR